MKKHQRYLTIEEKRKLALEGKRVPIVVNERCSCKERNGFITKIRSIWDGYLKNKRMKL